MDDDGTSNLEKIMKEILKELIKEKEEEEAKKKKKNYHLNKGDSDGSLTANDKLSVNKHSISDHTMSRKDALSRNAISQLNQDSVDTLNVPVPEE